MVLTANYAKAPDRAAMPYTPPVSRDGKGQQVTDYSRSQNIAQRTQPLRKHDSSSSPRARCLLGFLRIDLRRLFANSRRIDDELERIRVLILFYQLQIGEPLSA